MNVFTQNSIFEAKDSTVIEQIQPYYNYDILKQLLILDFIQLPPCPKFIENFAKPFSKKKTTRKKISLLKTNIFTESIFINDNFYSK